LKYQYAYAAEHYDVPDPIGQSPVPREVGDLLEQECLVIARAVVGTLLSDVGPH
jgi:hypothetical protein